jgi:hypothetical protein
MIISTANSNANDMAVLLFDHHPVIVVPPQLVHRVEVQHALAFIFDANYYDSFILGNHVDSTGFLEVEYDMPNLWFRFPHAITAAF